MRRRSVTLPGSSLTELTLPLAGHVGELMTNPETDALEIAEHYNGCNPAPACAIAHLSHACALENGQPAPKLDGKDDDWPLDNMTRVFGEMQIASRYLARPDLLAGTLRTDDHPAHLRWTYDRDFLYMLAVCPQDGMTKDRNTQWPVVAGAGGTARWWGSDGLQIELAALPRRPQRPNPGIAIPGSANGRESNTANDDRIVKIAFKPSGVVLVQTGQIAKAASGPTLHWTDGPPQGAATAVKYGISVQRSSGRVTSYTIEAAIPRAWIDAPAAPIDPAAAGPAPAPAWRINVLRHRAGDLVSTSWSGPIVEDDDVGMMGALVGE